jgi:hypothetical protein
MELYNKNIHTKLKDYKSNNINEEVSFLEQFKLINTNDKSIENKLKYKKITTPSTYNVVSDDELSMYPFNQFEKLNQMPSGRRDNSLVIKDYHSSENGYYSRPKEPMANFQDREHNRNTITDSETYLHNIDNFKERMRGQNTKKNNEGPPGTNMRIPEQILINGEVRVLPRTQEELRGQGVNSIRLQSEGLINEVGMIGKGKGIGDDLENFHIITKYPQKKYRDQTTADLLRTTGAFTKSSMRSRYLIDTQRSQSTDYTAPAKSLHGAGELRNNHSTNGTLFEEYMTNIPVTNVTNLNRGIVYHNNQPVNGTLFEEYMANIPVTNVTNVNGGTVYHNNQPANFTQIEDYIGNIPITNVTAGINKHTVRNNQPVNQTYRDIYTENEYTGHATNINNGIIYHNNQPANSTQIEEYIDNIPVTNVTARIGKHTVRNNQPANPTQNEEYMSNIPITNVTAAIGKHTVRNNQPANPTQTEEYMGNIPITNVTATIGKHTVRNNQSANPTMIEEYINNIPITNVTAGISKHTVRNNQPANPTYRNVYTKNEYTGHATNVNSGKIYYNNQPARKTHIESYVNTNYRGPNKHSTTLSYIKSDDKTRSGVVEEVLPKNYTGIYHSVTNKGVDRTFANNQINNERIEESINLLNRKMTGGTGQLSSGVENVGSLNINDEREKKTILNHGGYRNYGYKYLEDDIRGKQILQQRNNIDNNIITTVLNNNPYINNTQHKSTNKTDNIIGVTLLSDREINRNKY